MTGYHWSGPKPSLDGHFYAVAVRDGNKLYLRLARKGHQRQIVAKADHLNRAIVPIAEFPFGFKLSEQTLGVQMLVLVLRLHPLQQLVPRRWRLKVRTQRGGFLKL